jgi:hypothetical protein
LIFTEKYNKKLTLNGDSFFSLSKRINTGEKAPNTIGVIALAVETWTVRAFLFLDESEIGSRGERREVLRSKQDEPTC